MGDMADWINEQGEDDYYDHLNGHKNFPADNCPYCNEEEKKGKKK